MTQSELFASDDEWEPCTCPLGIVVGGQYADVPPTTGPENCSCEVHRDEWARAQWRPNRATRDIEAIRSARVARETLGYLPPLSALPVGGTVSKALSHDEICARIDSLHARRPMTETEHEQRPKCKCCEW